MDDLLSLNLPTAGQRGKQLEELSKAMTGLYKTQFGRGPTRSRSNYASNDLLICTLEDSLTPAEARLAEMGEHQRLRDVRTFFQHSSENEFISTVERITGRTVRAFISGIDTKQDVSSEIFYLEPQGK